MTKQTLSRTFNGAVVVAAAISAIGAFAASVNPQMPTSPAPMPHVVPHALERDVVKAEVATVEAESIEEEHAEKVGRALADKVQKGAYVGRRRLKAIEGVAAFLEVEGCPQFKYRAYKVDSGSATYLYLLAFNRDEVIAGKHFRILLHQNKADFASARSSTRRCLSLGAPPASRRMRLTSNATAPSEFHVLQSIVFDIALEVHASGKAFVISRGRVIRR